MKELCYNPQQRQKISMGGKTMGKGQNRQNHNFELIWIGMLLLCTVFLSGCSHKSEWAKSGGSLYYFDEDGEIVTDELREIDGELYLFDETGVFHTGWYQDGENWYYFDTTAKRFSGWHEEIYYGEDGIRYGSGSVEIDGNWYLLNLNGQMCHGWYMQGNRSWFYGEDGIRAVNRVSGYQGDIYYLDQDGYRVCNYLYTNDSGTYYFAGDGRAVTNAFLELEAGRFYFDENGHMVKDALCTIDGSTYYFDAEGHYCTGWVDFPEGRRYFGWDGVMLSGRLIEENGSLYYLNEDGLLELDQQIVIDGGIYLLQEDGRAFTGWSTDADGQAVYYGGDGRMAVSCGMTIDEEQYYFDQDGHVHTGWRKVDGTQYYYDEEGHMVKETVWTIGKKEYYFNEDGTMHTGLLYLDGKIYYYGTDGIKQYDQSVTVEGSKCLLTEDGSYYIGWLEKNGKKYYYQADGRQCFGDAAIDGNWYYFNADGSMLTGWLEVNGNQFYYGTDGIRYSGERTVYGVTYMFTDTGSYVVKNSSANAALGQSGNFTAGRKGYVVVIDPGHGGRFPGAGYNGLKEKDLTLTTALACKAELETYDRVTVYLTRSTDVQFGSTIKEDLEQRAIYAESVGADMLVSLHFNSSTFHSVSGASAYISMKEGIAEQSQGLANSILAQLGGLGLTNLGTQSAVSDSYVSADGTAADYYAINRHCADRGFPGIIIEHCFMDNATDLAYISTQEALQQLGVADATGIASYLKLEKKK